MGGHDREENHPPFGAVEQPGRGRAEGGANKAGPGAAGVVSGVALPFGGWRGPAPRRGPERSVRTITTMNAENENEAVLKRKEAHMETDGKKAMKTKAETKEKAAPRAGPVDFDPASLVLVPPKEAELAYERVRPELNAMSARGLRRITVAVPAAMTIGLGALPNIEARQEDFRRELPSYDFARAGRLREYAYAALYAHHRAAISSESEARLRALLEEAGPLREFLLRTAELHAYGGDLDVEAVSGIRRGTGHLDTANDLAQLPLLFRGASDKLKGRTPVTEAQLDRAAALSNEIVDALGKRRLGTDGAALPSKEEEERLKSFWLFHGVYEESRRAMVWVRWYEGDADLLVPSLFVGRRRRSSSDEPVEEPEPAEPVDPSETD